MGRNTLIQVRRGTTVQWSGQNPVLSQGEWGYNTDLGRFKIGDSLTSWNDLLWASIRPTSNDIVGSDGIGIDLSCCATGNTPLANIKVTGILSSQINDFNPSVSGLLPDITGVSGVSTSFDSSSNTWTVYLDNPSIEVDDIADFDERVDDRVAELLGVPSESPFRNISGINLSYNDEANTLDIGLDTTVVRTTGDGSISGNNLIISNNATFLSDINVSGNINVLGTGITFNEATVTLTTLSVANSGNFGNALTVGGVPVSLSGHSHVSTNITDFTEASQDAIATDAGGAGFLRNGSGLAWTYNDNANTLSVGVTGIPVSLITNLDEYIGDTIDTTIMPGTGIGLVYDSQSNQLYINVEADQPSLNSITTSNNGSGNLTLNASNVNATGNLTVGGNLVVQGQTTVVNSTVVDIGDNVIRVNTSGLSYGGIEVYKSGFNPLFLNSYEKLVWNTVNSRWEFSGPEVHSTGNIVGETLQSTAVWPTAPLIVASTGLVSNLNADFLDGRDGSYYLNASNITNGTLSTGIFPTYSAPNESLVVGGISFVTGLSFDNIGRVTGYQYDVLRVATDTQNGIARFSSDTFSVGTGNFLFPESGLVTIKTSGISNSQLAYSWTKIGNTELVLGSTVNSISGSSNNLVTLTYFHIDGGTP